MKNMQEGRKSANRLDKEKEEIAQEVKKYSNL